MMCNIRTKPINTYESFYCAAKNFHTYKRRSIHRQIEAFKVAITCHLTNLGKMLIGTNQKNATFSNNY